MPIEIRELVIKATVAQEPGPGANAPVSNNEVPQQEEIIKICVEKVLQILKEKHER